MTRRHPNGRAYAVLTLLAIAAPLVLAIVLRGLPPSDLAGAGLGAVTPALAGTLTMAAAGAALGALVAGLRGGSLAALLWTGAAAAVAGGALGLATGAGATSVSTAAAALFAAAAAVTDRLQVLVHGRTSRFAVATAAIVVAGIVAAADILPIPWLTGTIGPLLLAAGAVLAASAAIVGAGRPPAIVAGLTAVGAAALWLARGADANLVLALLALLVAMLVAARSLLEAEDTVATAPVDGTALPSLAEHLTDGVLRFDGRLQLRSWNPAAARLLVLDDAAAGTRLEDLLGVSLSELPPTGEPGRSVTAMHGLEATLHRDDDGLTVVLRDPGATRDADRLGRELRATIEELFQARRTVDIQRTELERAASTDPLTGVASRATILSRLDLEVAASRRYQHPVGIVLLDVDGLGELNATHGLAAGDAVLREVALRVRLRVREADALGRSGSDGFLAILPHTDEAGAATFADVLRRRVAGRPLAIEGTEVSVTISSGVAVIRPGEELDRDGLLARAAEALSSARGAGGNAVALDRLHGLARLERRAGGPAGQAASDTEEGRGA
jgi:diguanylate cyclase (GGDEF)-like protein